MTSKVGKMIDVGFNLLTRAICMDMSLTKVDKLIQSLAKGKDPYSIICANSVAEIGHRVRLIEKLAHEMGINPQVAFCELCETMPLIYQIVDACDDDDFQMEGTVYVDSEGSCLADVDLFIGSGGFALMQVSLRLVDLNSDKCKVREATILFHTGWQWQAFDIDSGLIDLDLLRTGLEGRYDFDLLLKGIEVFSGGPSSLAEHIRSLLTGDEMPWRKGEGGDASAVELYIDTRDLEPFSSSYRATIDGEEYDILLTVDADRVWDVQSIWQGKFTFDAYWVDRDDVWLQLVVQNAYETYDIARLIVDDILDRLKEHNDEPEESPIVSSTSEELRLDPGHVPEMCQSLSKPVERVHVGDLVVRSTVRTCGNDEHDIREVTAVICIFTPGIGVTEVSVDAFCCPQCKRYYIMEEDFRRLRAKGSLCCRVVERDGRAKEFSPHNGAELSEQSFYNSLGYNVGRQDELTPAERRSILDFAITNGFKSQKATIGFLQWLIDFNGRRANMSGAVEKWKSDIKYLMTSHDAEVERVKIDRVFLTKHRW